MRHALRLWCLAVDAVHDWRSSARRFTLSIPGEIEDAGGHPTSATPVAHDLRSNKNYSSSRGIKAVQRPPPRKDSSMPG